MNMVSYSNPDQTTAILRLEHIKKYFGGVKAVDDVSFSIAQGEVHAIVGENGAGKSTLMNILAGVYRVDSGTIYYHGERFDPENPRMARAKGISTVFQELNLFEDLNVEANLFAGNEVSHHGILAHSAMQERSSQLLQAMNIALAPTDMVGELPIGQRQWVEIARAMTENSDVLILDEPNSALNQSETEDLFRLIENLKARGITVIYISHRLEEVFRIADRITVMRDGHYIHTWKICETAISEVVAAMIGRKVTELSVRHHQPAQDVVLETQSLSYEDRLQNVSVRVHKGEVVGVVGLSGAGTTELFEMLFGIQRPTSGKILFRGEELKIGSPKIAMNHKVAMVPSDRRNLGLMLNWSVLDNISLAVANRLAKFGILQHRDMKAMAQNYVEQLQVATDNLGKQVQFLSGGNQQKVLLSRWLATNPELLILDDPTRGIDVRAKQEIYELVDQIACQNVSVLVTSSELDEILLISDRVLVLRKGKLVADLPSKVCDKTLVMEFVAGDPQSGKKKLLSRLSDFSLEENSIKLFEENFNTTSDPQAVEDPSSGGNRQTAAQSPTGKRLVSGFNDIGSTIKKIGAVREMGVLQALIFVTLLFSLLSPFFFTIDNISLILRQMSIVCLISIGMTFALSSGEVDLSVGWIFNAAMSCMAFLSVTTGLDAWLLIPVGLIFGLVLGAINGLLAVGLNLPTMIITLGTMTIYRGISLAINQGRTISGLPESTFFTIGKGGIGPISYMSIIMLVFIVIGAWVWKNSVFVRHLLIMGGNSTAAERVGVQNKRLRIVVMAFSGLMCGFAAVLGLSFLGAADAQIGRGYEMLAVASAIIGGAQLNGGSGTIWGTLIGVGLIMTIQNGLVIVGMSPAWQTTFTGIVILTAVAIGYLTKNRRRRAVEKKINGA
ncbi:MAG TPA: ATP-binding cassette domain-containing protein [Anaerolineaceae bacterium]|nr:ATP-binding cassette domain-containing protein [Anaerolineaceae bacterium]